MSVIGFDIGNESCVITAVKCGGIHVMLNDESKRETPSVVSFGEKQRLLGSAGAASATANTKSTISQVKRLIGRVYDDPRVKEDLKLLPFETSESRRGGILIELEYLKEIMVFTPVQILGMLFTHLKQIAEKNLESDIADCVIGIPSYFTDLQRHEYLKAAQIAGLNPLRLMHDCTATALGYGMYKTDLLKGRPTYVIFVDIGHCDTQVTVAAFEEGKMKILSHSFDQNLGGRDFDEVLFKHFAAQFEKNYNIDVNTDARAKIRLRASCEKLKKVLSANADATISIDCLIGDRDVRGSITREEFEKLSLNLLKRVTKPCCKAIEDSRLSTADISVVELVGSGSRIPAIMKILTLLFKREPMRTLNASECVARGCALRCAMLSPTQQDLNYEIEDVLPYSIGAGYETNNAQPDLMLLAKGEPFPGNYSLSYGAKIPPYIRIYYTDMTDSPNISSFEIDQPKISDAKMDFKLLVKSNEDGIIECFSQFEYKHNNLGRKGAKKEIENAQKTEKDLQEQYIKVEQAKEERNTLESFVYNTRSKLSSPYQNLANDFEKKEITDKLQEIQNWLNDDSYDESEQDYTGKQKELQKLLDPIESRYKEEKAKEQKEKRNTLKSFIHKTRSKLSSTYQSLANEFEKKEITDKLKNTENWLNDDSYDESKKDYTGKQKELQKLLVPIESRYKEEKAKEQKEKRNTLKSFIHKTRSKLSSTYWSLANEFEKKEITDKLKNTENWLNDDSYDESKKDYTGKQKELQKLLDPIESRYKEEKAKEQKEKSWLPRQIERFIPSASQTLNFNQGNEPVDSEDGYTESDQRGETVDTDQTDGAVDSDQRNSDQRDGYITSDQLNQPPNDPMPMQTDEETSGIDGCSHNYC